MTAAGDTNSHLTALPGLALAALLLAGWPLALWWRRQRDATVGAKLAALTALTAFLTFDLIVFGAFTRLTDSGLGCPDWPGCYAHASPLGAQAPIAAAQAAQPTGPVTAAKAWIEMLHRWLAMAVGVLIIVATALAWRHRRALPVSPWWLTLTLGWVIVQGLFGKYTVTWKLYPAIVTLHLLGALLLLALLVGIATRLAHARLMNAPVGRGAVAAVLALLVLQSALGGWVSSNYAVLACRGFPACNGQWWPAADFGHGFTLLRELGRGADGLWLPADALVAIHLTHRLFALLASAAAALLAWRLLRGGGHARSGAGYGRALAALLTLQWASGLSNVVLDWPIVAALLHSAGAALLVALLVALGMRLPVAAAAAGRGAMAGAAPVRGHAP